MGVPGSLGVSFDTAAIALRVEDDGLPGLDRLIFKSIGNQAGIENK